MNERYLAYLETTSKPKNHEYMAFINKMKIDYILSLNPNMNRTDALYSSISNHDDFTKFIKDNV